MKKYILITLLSFSLAQVFSLYDYTGSRATSMSGAVTSGPAGIWSIFHNPAQLSDLDNINLSSGYSNIFNLAFLPYYNFGISYDSYAINIEKLSTTIGNDDLSSETALGFSKGFLIYKDRQSKIQSGLRFNFYQYKFGQSAGPEGDGSIGSSNLGQGSGYGLDVGLQGSLNNRFYIAYYLQNIYSNTIGYGLGVDLPNSFSIGISYLPYEDLLTSLDINQMSGNINQEVRFGIEYILFDYLTIRAGIQNNPNRFSGGFAYKVDGLGDLSYGFITHHILPVTHQLTFSMKLNK